MCKQDLYLLFIFLFLIKNCLVSGIRTTLLDSEEHICFTCKQSDVSPDNLIANKFLRQVNASVWLCAFQLN